MDGAIAVLKKIVSIGPEQILTHYNMAVIFEAKIENMRR